MGINGLWDEVERVTIHQKVSLAAESAKCVAEQGRPLRLAVDALIVLYKVINATRSQWEKKPFKGWNHATKAFVNHVKHMLCEGVELVFVFDGPRKPQLKRGHQAVFTEPNTIQNKTVTEEDEEDEVIRAQFEIAHTLPLVKHLLSLMGVAVHEAPGEAEAERVALEEQGIVDGIVTTDGDCLAFGAKRVFRYRNKMSDGLWQVEAATLEEAGYTKMHWILLAWMSGGDYHNGIWNCGSSTALDVARAITAADESLRTEFDMIARSGVKEQNFQDKLQRQRELVVNAIRGKPAGGAIAGRPESAFPEARILGLYMRPLVSSVSALDQLKTTIWEPKRPAYTKLREATAEYFTWYNQDRARQFLHIYAPGLLAKDLLLSGHQRIDRSDLIVEVKRSIVRKPITTPVVTVQYKALKVIPIDYDGEPRPIGELIPGKPIWDEDNKHDPRKLYETKLPEFLVQWGAPSRFASLPKSKKRNSAQTDPEEPPTKKKRTPASTKRQPLSDVPHATNRSEMIRADPPVGKLIHDKDNEKDPRKPYEFKKLPESLLKFGAPSCFRSLPESNKRKSVQTDPEEPPTKKKRTPAPTKRQPLIEISRATNGFATIRF